MHATSRAACVCLQGLLWVWPDDSATAAEDSKKVGAEPMLLPPDASDARPPQEPPRLLEELHDPGMAGRVSAPTWRSTILPYSHEYFIEVRISE